VVKKKPYVQKEGFKFKFNPEACTKCQGKCCNGKSGNIFVKRKEIKRKKITLVFFLIKKRTDAPSILLDLISVRHFPFGVTIKINRKRLPENVLEYYYFDISRNSEFDIRFCYLVMW